MKKETVYIPLTTPEECRKAYEEIDRLNKLLSPNNHE